MLTCCTNHSFSTQKFTDVWSIFRLIDLVSWGNYAAKSQGVVHREHNHGLLSACKAVIGIVCDAHWVGGRDIYEVKKWSWSSFWPVSPRFLRSKRMREAKTPCRTPWNLISMICQLALDTMYSHLHVYDPTLPLPWDLHQRFIYNPGMVRETTYRQSKRNYVYNRNCLKDSQVKWKRSHKLNDIPQSDIAYSKLPFNKVDANLPIERMPLERSCIEWYIVRVITATRSLSVELTRGNVLNRLLSSNSAALINWPITRCPAFVATSKLPRVDVGTHMLSSINPTSTLQITM